MAIKSPSATSPIYETKKVITKKVIIVIQKIPYGLLLPVDYILPIAIKTVKTIGMICMFNLKRRLVD